jgi:hypothetical protein
VSIIVLKKQGYMCMHYREMCKALLTYTTKNIHEA